MFLLIIIGLYLYNITTGFIFPQNSTYLKKWLFYGEGGGMVCPKNVVLGTEKVGWRLVSDRRKSRLKTLKTRFQPCSQGIPRNQKHFSTIFFHICIKNPGYLLSQRKVWRRLVSESLKTAPTILKFPKFRKPLNR